MDTPAPADSPQSDAPKTADVEEQRPKQRFDWKDLLDRSRNVATVLAALIACSALFYSCRTSSRLEQTNFMVVGLANRPQLVAIQPITITKIDVQKMSVSLKPGSKVEASFSMIIHSRIRLRNEAPNALASIYTVLTTGATEKYASAKAIALGLTTPTEVTTHAFPRFQQLQVLPTKSATLPLTQNSQDYVELEMPVAVSIVKEQTFLMNYIVFYKNEYGNLYHTHVKAPFVLKSFEYPTAGIPEQELEGKIREFLTHQLVSQNAFEPLPVVHDFGMYNHEETMFARTHLRSRDMRR